MAFTCYHFKKCYRALKANPEEELICSGPFYNMVHGRFRGSEQAIDSLSLATKKHTIHA